MLCNANKAFYRGLVSASGAAAKKKRFSDVHLELRKAIDRRGNSELLGLGQQAAMMTSNWDEVMLVITAYWESKTDVPLTTYKTLMQMYSKSRDWKRLNCLFEMFKQVEAYPTDRDTGRLAAKMFANTGNVEGLNEIFTEILASTHIQDITLYGSELKTLIKTLRLKRLNVNETKSAINLCVLINQHLKRVISGSKYPRNIVLIRSFHPHVMMIIRTIPTPEAAKLAGEFHNEFFKWVRDGGGHYAELDPSQQRSLPAGFKSFYEDAPIPISKGKMNSPAAIQSSS